MKNSNYWNFWEAGYKIFGLYGQTDGKCNCGREKCKAVLKHPRANHWQHTPHWSEEQLDVMEKSNQFDTGYGILLSGLLVIDVDSRNGGVESYENLCKNIPVITGAGLIVETGSGNGSKHLFFSIDKNIALVTKHEEYPGIDFKSSGYVVGAGSLHESGNIYNIVVGTPHEIEAAPSALLELLEKPEYYRSDGKDISDDDISTMLNFISPDCGYEKWIRCGMAIHHSTQGVGFELWDKWSAGANEKDYPGTDALEYKWHSFGKSTKLAAIGTLIHFAKENGYQEPVTFDSNIVLDVKEQDIFDIDVSDIDVSDIDLRRPPGFAGEITAYINSQCLFPRENIAAIAAIIALGNITGLRYEDDITGATGNLFVFCIADSSTGKESILQAIIEILRVAGISLAIYGNIKSQQEIIRNLARHQGAFYLMDELGEELQKIVNAQKKGGAPYLDGIIGTLMSAYSKANGYMLLTGDMKEKIKMELAAEKAKAGKGQDYADEIIEEISQQENSIDNGLEKPFLSLIGFSAKVTFEAIATYKQAQSGFLGRAILVDERDTNPKPKKKFRKAEMPVELKNTLMTLFTPGEFNTNPRVKIEWRKPRVPISTSPEAEKLLEKISDWLFYEWAEKEKETSSLEAVVRRGFEQICKVSLILASTTGIRTVEHVRWALALIKRDLSEKIGMVQAQSDNNITAKILALISYEHAESQTLIINRCRPTKKIEVEKELARLQKAGKIEKVLVAHAQSKKKKVEKWRLCY